MGLFKQLYKSTRLSHLLLGIVALCAFSSVCTASNPNETKLTSVQQVVPFYQLVSKKLVISKKLHHSYPLKSAFNRYSQAVTLIEFFVKKYQFLEMSGNPIRAGPSIL